MKGIAEEVPPHPGSWVVLMVWEADFVVTKDRLVWVLETEKSGGQDDRNVW